MCSITVNVTNNTGQGPITFNSFSFLNETKGKFSPNGPPFQVPCNIQADGVTVQALYSEGYIYTKGSPYGTPEYAKIDASGTAVFNMPNGDTLTIIWDLDPKSDDNKTPTFTPGSDVYNYAGISTPIITNGNDYEFNVTIS